MQVLSVRCGLTKNLGNFESAKLEVEASPSDGQTADQLLAEVSEYIAKQAAAVCANDNGNSKPVKKIDAPLKADSPADESPFGNGEPVKKPAAKKSTKAETRAAMTGKPEHERELTYALESESLEELLDRFNGVRKMAPAFGGKWEQCVTKVADRYRKLNSLDADPVVLGEIIAAFKAERTAVDKMKNRQLAEVA